MDERILLLLGLGVAAYVASQSGGGVELTAAQEPPASEQLDLTPSEGLSGLGELGQATYTPSRWYSLDRQGYLKLYIPFPVRGVSTGPNSGKTQFQYNGRWYDTQNLLLVWNPIKQLPRWLRCCVEKLRAAHRQESHQTSMRGPLHIRTML